MNFEITKRPGRPKNPLSNSQNPARARDEAPDGRADVRMDRTEETARKVRVPIGIHRERLSVSGRKGYVRRWFNDVPGRIAFAIEGGWTFVEDQSLKVGNEHAASESKGLGVRVNRLVNQSTGLKAYLMEIKEEYYKEDQEAKARTIREFEEMIRRREFKNFENAYAPKEDVTLSH